MKLLIGLPLWLVAATILMGHSALASGPCDGITAQDFKEALRDRPRTMNGVAAKPVAASEPINFASNGVPVCAAHVIISFDGRIGYDYLWLLRQDARGRYLEPTYGNLTNPPPIRLYQ